MPSPKTIIVSNRLPVRIEKDGDKLAYKSSEGGLATALGSIYKEGDNIWVGWPGASFESEALKAEVTEGLKKESMRPVFLSDEDLENSTSALATKPSGRLFTISFSTSTTTRKTGSAMWR